MEDEAGHATDHQGNGQGRGRPCISSGQCIGGRSQNQVGRNAEDAGSGFGAEPQDHQWQGGAVQRRQGRPGERTTRLPGAEFSANDHQSLDGGTVHGHGRQQYGLGGQVAPCQGQGHENAGLPGGQGQDGVPQLKQAAPEGHQHGGGQGCGDPFEHPSEGCRIQQHGQLEQGRSRHEAAHGPVGHRFGYRQTPVAGGYNPCGGQQANFHRRKNGGGDLDQLGAHFANTPGGMDFSFSAFFRCRTISFMKLRMSSARRRHSGQ